MQLHFLQAGKSVTKIFLMLNNAYTRCFSIMSHATVCFLGDMARFLPASNDEQRSEEIKNNENTIGITAVLNGCQNLAAGGRGSENWLTDNPKTIVQ